MTVDQQQRPGPPDPRRRSRRDEILEIAVGLFAARGYDGVSMDDIGSAAGVTGPALYHHFAGKEAMLVAALIFIPLSRVRSPALIYMTVWGFLTSFARVLSHITPLQLREFMIDSDIRVP